MNKEELKKVEEEIDKVEAHRHGEIVLKIKNGYVYRIIQTYDTLLDLTKSSNCGNTR